VQAREEGKGKTRLVRDDKRVKLLLQRYNFLDMDEIHKLTSHDNLRFGYMNQLSKGMDFVYGNTGTLFGKNVEDLWSPFYLVDRGETFGENLGPFRAAYFDVKMNPWKGAIYTFRKDMDQTLHAMLQHRSIRYEEREMHDLPRAVPRKLRFHMGDEQREHYLRALEGLINAGGDLREMDAQWIRMRQIVSGYLAWKDDSGDHVLHFKDNPKLDALEALMDEVGGNKVGIVYWYTETGHMIVERLRKAGYGVEWLYGGTKDHEALRDRFMKDSKSQVLVMQADTGGTGLDGLQKVSHYVFMYETPTDPTTRRQVEKRWIRPGQKHRVFVYDFIMARSLDSGILEDIQEGINTHDAVVNGRRKGRGFFLKD
jgi:SNF2 family DNA or RNA helicase